MQEVGRVADCSSHSALRTELEARVNLLHETQGDCYSGEHKTCYSRYKTCLYLSVVFSIIVATVVIIIYVALGGLRGGGV